MHRQRLGVIIAAGAGIIASFPRQLRVGNQWAAEPLDLLRELRKRKPTVVHFSGHGSSADGAA
jgi:hypothetical protein